MIGIIALCDVHGVAATKHTNVAVVCIVTVCVCVFMEQCVPLWWIAVCHRGSSYSCSVFGVVLGTHVKYCSGQLVVQSSDSYLSDWRLRQQVSDSEADQWP